MINNSGTFDSSTDDAWVWGVSDTPVFNNLAGAVFKKTFGDVAFPQEISPAFNNSGLVDIQSGGAWFSGGGTSSGTFNVAAGSVLRISDFNYEFGLQSGSPITTPTSGLLTRTPPAARPPARRQPVARAPARHRARQRPP